MGYRIRVVPEVEVWLQRLRDSDPSAADLVDDALDTLREAGAAEMLIRCRTRYEHDRGGTG